MEIGPHSAVAAKGSIIAVPAVSVSSLTCRLGRTNALSGVTFDVVQGERLAVLGRNGSGKTTLLRAIAGLVTPRTGHVAIAGGASAGSVQDWRALIGFAGHVPHLYDNLTVRENLAFKAELFGVDGAEQRLSELLNAVSLRPYADRRARELSHGLQQRLSLASALLPLPRILLLDEPESALDEPTRERLGELVADYAPDASLLIASHDLSMAASLADRALVLEGGSLIADFPITARDSDGLRISYAAALRRPRAPAGPSASPPCAGAETRGPAYAQAPARRQKTTRQIAAMIGKDLRIELRTREVLPALALLALLLLISFSLAFVIPSEDAPAVAAGALWASLTFATMIAVLRSFAAERDRGTMDALLLAPVSRPAIYVAKAAVNFLLLTVVGLIAALGAGVLFAVPLVRWETAAVVALGSAALASIGTLYGAVASNLRARELLMPVLLLPVSLPVLIAGVAATLDIIGVTSDAARFPWIGLLAAFCAIFVSVAVLLFDQVFRE